MNKIYIGNTEVANVGSGGGGGQEFNPSDYVDASTWNEHEKVIASALVNLKGLEDQIEAFDADIQAQETALLAEVHVVEQQKADASVVYTKKEIDKSDKIVAAALASLNERVSTLETSSGGGGESGDSFDPEYLEVELADVSARVDALEQVDYVVTNDISAFVKENDISTFVTDSSITANYYDKVYIDASIAAIDASLIELAQSGGGGSAPDLSDYVTTNDISTFIDNTYYNLTKVTNSNNKIGYVINSDSTTLNNNYYSSLKGNYNYHLGPVGNIANRTYGAYGLSIGDGACAGDSAFAVGYGVNAKGNFSAAFGCSNNSLNTAGSEYSFVLGYNCQVQDLYAKYAHAEGQETICMAKYQYGSYFGQAAHAEGYGCKTLGNHSHAEGYNSSTGQNGQAAHAEGYYTFAEKYCSHSEGCYTKTSASYQHVEGVYNSDSSLSLHIVGNGTSSSRHNAFEVRQSGDIYVADVSAAGLYYEKPMINLQQKLYALDASIQSLSAGGGGSSTDLTNYVFLHHDSQNDTFKLKSTEPGGHSAPVTELYIETLKTSSIMSTDPLTDNFILIESGEMYIKRNETLYQIDLDAFVTSFGTDVTQ